MAFILMLLLYTTKPPDRKNRVVFKKEFVLLLEKFNKINKISVQFSLILEY